jgi:YebC/PmpR family DNA-binding regulatory protein
MARHSKWHNIQVRKGAMDKKRGKAFTRHAKLIEIAARQGGSDLETNATLRTAVENAKMDNVPNANIDRAIKKGTGELKDGSEILEAFFEGYGPHGVAMYVQVLTDSRNRAVGTIKTILSKNGGAMGEAGSVAWMFERRGCIVIPVGTPGSAGATNDALDALQLAAIDAGAQDVRVEMGDAGAPEAGTDHQGGRVVIFTGANDLHRVQKALQEKGYTPSSSELTYIPSNEIRLTDVQQAKSVLHVIDLLEEDEDITNVYTNLDIAEEILGQI